MKIIIHGPANHIFSRILAERSQSPQENIQVEIIEAWSDLLKQAPDSPGATILLINKNEKAALEILALEKKNRVLMCQGGEKNFQPNLTQIAADKNHRRFLFENWDDFISKVKHEAEAEKAMLLAGPEDDVYQINYQNLPDFTKRQEKMVNKNFFWFSVYFSKIYLFWFSKWVEEMQRKKWPLKLSLSKDGRIKKLLLPFSNLYKGELIFREGETIILSSEEDDAPPKNPTIKEAWEYEDRMRLKEAKEANMSPEEREKRKIYATVLSADEESLEILLPKSLEKSLVAKTQTIFKGDNILEKTVTRYQNTCSGYSDLSQNDYIYTEADHYDRPEDFLRGYIPNHNKLHLPIHSVKLDGPAKAILYDQSQIRALADMLGPGFISLIEGGPGTGKTLLTAIAIKQLIRARRIVLLTSHSNKGLDNILETLLEYVGADIIFRFGNNHNLISSEKIKKLHRHHRFEKQRLAAEKTWQSAQKTKEPGRPKFDSENFCLKKENEMIWQLLCSGKSLVIAATVNSVVFDKQLGALFFQNRLINERSVKAAKKEAAEIETRAFEPSEGVPGENPKTKIAEEALEKDDALKDLFQIPVALEKCLQADPQRARPFFAIDVTVIDEATKARLFELVPLIKRTDYKLILIGDTDQLGNIQISPEAKKEILETVHNQCRVEDGYFVIRPQRLCTVDYALSPLRTDWSEIVPWFDYFSEGIFSSLIKAGQLSSERLKVNRRSLEGITKFLNHVFRKDLLVGRFDPYSHGSVTFLDLKDSTEERIRTSYKNRREKIFVVQETLDFFAKQKRQKGAVNLRSLGIIATYRGQINLIKERLRKELLYHPLFKGLVTPENIDSVLKEMINTVDAFQGSEKDGIILSLVRSNRDGRIGFSVDLRRIYVALSRARNDLIIIGNSRTFLKNSDKTIAIIFNRIISYTQKQKTYGLK